MFVVRENSRCERVRPSTETRGSIRGESVLVVVSARWWHTVTMAIVLGLVVRPSAVGNGLLEFVVWRGVPAGAEGCADMLCGDISFGALQGVTVEGTRVIVLK